MSKRKIIKNLTIYSENLKKGNFACVCVYPYEDYLLPTYDPEHKSIEHIIQVGGENCNFGISFNGKLCQEFFSIGSHSYVLMRSYEDGKLKETTLYTTCADVREILPIKPSIDTVSKVLEYKRLSDKSKKKLLRYARRYEKE